MGKVQIMKVVIPQGMENELVDFVKKLDRTAEGVNIKLDEPSIFCGKDFIKAVDGIFKKEDAPLRKPAKKERRCFHDPENLCSTIKDMRSNDYKKRFRAEYNQLCIRYNKLKHFYDIYKAGHAAPEPGDNVSPLQAYKIQLSIMEDYKDILELRAELEHIPLK